MKNIIFTYSYCILSAFLLYTMQACDRPMEDSIAPVMKSFHLNSISELPASVKTNCYLFRGNILYQIVRDLSPSFNLSIPEKASLYFFAGDTEPAELLNVKEGVTTLEDFLNIRTNTSSDKTFKFYTTAITDLNSSTDFDIKLHRIWARIDVDKTSSNLLEIDKLVVSGKKTSTLLFKKDNYIHPSTRQGQVRGLNSSSVKDQFLEVYESEDPLDIAIEGLYDDIPIIFRTTLPKVMRNHQYTLKLVNAGAEITGVFEVNEWTETDTINTAPNADEKIIINEIHSVFPNGTNVDSSGQSISIPHTGGEVTLAFLAASPVDFESIIDEDNNLDVDMNSQITRESGKILTKYKIHVKGQGENTMPYATTLKPKSVLRQYSSSQISLIVQSPPLYIREVTLGGLTWMAFNVQSKNDIIYPIKGNNVEAMYNNEWITSLGGMFQYGRLYRYAPWESGINNQGNQSVDDSWTNATKTPCPEGYRLPTYKETTDFFGNYTGGGLVPGKWKAGNGEEITATIETASNSQININGVIGTAKFLKLVGSSKGDILYIPFGGMKSNTNPSDKNPQFSQGFRLWLSEESSNDPSKAWSIFCGNLNGVDAQIKNIAFIEADKESYAYARCVKR